MFLGKNLGIKAKQHNMKKQTYKVNVTFYFKAPHEEFAQEFADTIGNLVEESDMVDVESKVGKVKKI